MLLHLWDLWQKNSDLCSWICSVLSQLHTQMIVHLNVDSAVHMCLMDPLKITFKSSLHTWMRWALFPVQHEGKDGFSQSATWPAGAPIKYSSAPFTASWTLQETHKHETVRASAWSHCISVHLCLTHYQSHYASITNDETIRPHWWWVINFIAHSNTTNTSGTGTSAGHLCKSAH